MIVITGASRGIGHFLMQKLINEGLDVIGIYNNTIPEENHELMYKVDVSDAENVKSFVSANGGILKRISLINCAGSNYNAYAHKADPLKWAQLISINLIGTFNIINALLPIMREESFGRIINFSSVVAQNGIPGTSAYAASKAGLWGMTKAIAVENASKGITINNLNLGYFNIGMINEVPQEIKEVIKSKIAIGHQFGDPNNIFEAIKFIIKAPYLTGTSIDINGGII